MFTSIWKLTSIRVREAAGQGSSGVRGRVGPAARTLRAFALLATVVCTAVPPAHARNSVPEALRIVWEGPGSYEVFSSALTLRLPGVDMIDVGLAAAPELVTIVVRSRSSDRVAVIARMPDGRRLVREFRVDEEQVERAIASTVANLVVELERLPPEEFEPPIDETSSEASPASEASIIPEPPATVADEQSPPVRDELPADEAVEADPERAQEPGASARDPSKTRTSRQKPEARKRQRRPRTRRRTPRKVRPERPRVDRVAQRAPQLELDLRGGMGLGAWPSPPTTFGKLGGTVAFVTPFALRLAVHLSYGGRVLRGPKLALASLVSGVEVGWRRGGNRVAGGVAGLLGFSAQWYAADGNWQPFDHGWMLRSGLSGDLGLWLPPNQNLRLGVVVELAYLGVAVDGTWRPAVVERPAGVVRARVGGLELGLALQLLWRRTFHSQPRPR